MNLLSPMDLQLQLHQQMLYRQQQITLHHNRPEETTPSSHGWLVPPSPGAGPPLPREITVELQNKRLWQQFHAESTEMIITKLGRRMFPSVQLSLGGLDRQASYCLLLEVAPASRRRHKYVGGGGGENGSPESRGWTSAGPAEPQPHVNRRVYLHPDSPASGAHWMQHPVSFGKLKLTNNAVDRHSNVVLTSMHKYVPKIWIIRCDDITSLNTLYSQPASCFAFPETEFIAVTAYQNENITKLKIDHNPFAKGFRETGQSRCKRKFHHLTSGDCPNDYGSSSIRNSCAVGEDEEGNVSSSESESNRASRHQARRAKRAMSEAGSLEDSSVSSSGGASPPLPSASSNPSAPSSPHSSSSSSSSSPGGTGDRHNPQTPRLYRPWTDSSPLPPSEPAFFVPAPLFPPSLHFFHPFVAPPPSLHRHPSSAFELARVQQLQRYQGIPFLTEYYH